MHHCISLGLTGATSFFSVVPELIFPFFWTALLQPRGLSAAWRHLRLSRRPFFIVGSFRLSDWPWSMVVCSMLVVPSPTSCHTCTLPESSTSSATCSWPRRAAILQMGERSTYFLTVPRVTGFCLCLTTDPAVAARST